MVPSFTTAIALGLSLALVVESITLPDVVTANTDLHLDLSAQVAAGAKAALDSYAVFLAIAPLSAVVTGYASVHSWKTGSCYLVRSSPNSVTEQTVQIPSSAGPVEEAYSINTFSFNKSAVITDTASGFWIIDQESSPYHDVPNGVLQTTGSFSLGGGTGKWSQSEMNGTGLGSLVQQNNVPCSAYDCARKCVTTLYPFPEPVDSGYGVDGWPKYVKETYACIQKCPGVTYVDIEKLAEVYGRSDEVSDDITTSSVITSTVLGPLSITTTQTVFSTSVSFQSIPSSGAAAPTSYSNGTVTSGSAFPSSTSSRTATPTIATTPSPTSAGSRSGLGGAVPLIGSSLAIAMLVLGF